MKAMLIGLSLLAAIVGGLFAFTAFEQWRIEARFPPSGAFVVVNGVRLHYTERRPIGAPRATVVLIHGASGSQADMMIPLGDRLAQRGYRVFAFDRPGLGWSERPSVPDSASLPAQATLIADATQALGVPRAIVVVHSLAGVIGTNLAITRKDFTQGLVLLSPVDLPWPGGDVSGVYRLAATPVVGWLFSWLAVMPVGLATFEQGVASVFAPLPTPPNYVERTGAKLILRPASFRYNAQDVVGTYATVIKQGPRLGEITAPTAIVTGDHDEIVLTRIHSYGAERDIPGATLTVLPGVGHSPHWADPEAVVQVIENVAERAGVAALAQVGVGAR